MASTDEKLRELERTAATGGPEDRIRLSQARCRAGEHSWSAWANRSNHPAADWPDLAFELEVSAKSRVTRGGVRSVPLEPVRAEERQCFWCGLEERRLSVNMGALVVSSDGTVNRALPLGSRPRKEQIYSAETPGGGDPVRGMGDWLELTPVPHGARIKDVELSLERGEARSAEHFAPELTASTSVFQRLHDTHLDLHVHNDGEYRVGIRALARGQGEVAVVSQMPPGSPRNVMRQFWSDQTLGSWNAVMDAEGWIPIDGSVFVNLSAGESLSVAWRAARRVDT